MKIRKAERKQAKIKIAIQVTSAPGKYNLTDYKTMFPAAHWPLMH